ncbi:RDD family protein [Lichenicola sp.]|uniref:RDD family protein n=1 Tax=Lichenicola sp. TaxID=2804529 RepID=UPI003B00FD22
MSDPYPPPGGKFGGGPNPMPGAFQPYPLPSSATGAMVLSYAGFWWRVLAWLIDGMVLTAVEYVFGLASGMRQPYVTTNDDQAVRQISDIAYTTRVASSEAWSVAWPGTWHMHGSLMSLLVLVLTLGYFVLMESSHWQATIGKRVCRMRVTDLAGRRIGIARALGRYLGKFVSAVILGIGFLMVGWTRRKQGLHDIMAGTLVMRLRPADTVFAFQAPPAA